MSEGDTQHISYEQKGKSREQPNDSNQIPRPEAARKIPQATQGQASLHSGDRSQHESQRHETRDEFSKQNGSGSSEALNRSSSPTVQDNRSATQSQAGGDNFTWATLQQYQQPKLRIRADLTKVTSFDRKRDGDELYELWVGPP